MGSSLFCSGYMAPEYAMRGCLTSKADVYSFGVVALEIVSGKSNTNYRPKEEFVYLLDWVKTITLKKNQFSSCISVNSLVLKFLFLKYNKYEASNACLNYTYFVCNPLFYVLTISHHSLAADHASHFFRAEYFDPVAFLFPLVLNLIIVSMFLIFSWIQYICISQINGSLQINSFQFYKTSWAG